jgi:hypothetical protein
MSSALTVSRMEEKASRDACWGAWGALRSTVSSVAMAVVVVLVELLR